MASVEGPNGRARGLQRFGLAVLAMLLVVAYGLIGYLMAGWSLLEALYMVVISITTVGYGEVRPVDTTALRIHTMLLILFGTATLGYSVAVVIQYVTEGEIRRYLGRQRVKRQIEGLKQHIIVAGIGRMGALICGELAETGVPFVVIDRKTERAAELESRGWLVVSGDATDEEVLRQARLDQARALVSAIPNDAENVFITLTARDMAPNVRILARAEQPSTQKKLLQAGADQVVSPASIGAHRVVIMLLNPEALQITELLSKTMGVPFEVEELEIDPDSPFAGRSLRDADIGRKTGVMVLAVKHANGGVDFPPRGDRALAIGDRIVFLGRPESIETFREHYPTR